MNRPGPPAEALPDPTTKPAEGWHCLHMYYRVKRSALALMSQKDRKQGMSDFVAAFNPQGDAKPAQMQSYVVSGHRADLGLMIMDPDPLKIDAVHQSVMSGALGAALEPSYSFVSLSEISEYVPTVEQYAEKLQKTGTSPDDPSYQAKVKAYEGRLPAMNKQRLYPDFPAWPVHCFYPMNKIRIPGANWFMEPFSKRSALMAEHATSGIKFAGKVSQLITVSTGYDDWEWGVTLWGRCPEYITNIVYTMRFDEASAKYAEFGPFYIGYQQSAEEILKHLKVEQNAILSNSGKSWFGS